MDRCARLWDLTPQLAAPLVTGLNGPDVAADGERVLYTTGCIGGVQHAIFCDSDGNVVCAPGEVGYSNGHVGIAPDGRAVIACIDGSIWLWDLDADDFPAKQGDTGRWLWGAWLLANEEFLIYGFDTADVETWSPGDGHSFGSLSSESSAVAVSPSGRRILVGGPTGYWGLYDLDDEAGSKPMRVNHGKVSDAAIPVTAMAFVGERRALIADGSGAVVLWDLDASHTVWSAPDPSGRGRAALSLAVSPGGARIAAGGVDGAIQVWDFEGDAPPLVLALRDPSPVTGLALPPRIASSRPTGGACAGGGSTSTHSVRRSRRSRCAIGRRRSCSSSARC